MTLTLFAGTVGALTVIYEFARGYPIFTDPTKYLWNTLPGGLFSRRDLQQYATNQ